MFVLGSNELGISQPTVCIIYTVYMGQAALLYSWQHSVCSGMPVAILKRQLAWQSEVQFLAGATERPNQNWGPPALLFNAYRGYFSAEKTAGAW